MREHLDERAFRVLGVVYILSEGRTDVSVPIKEVTRYIEEHRIFDMTDEEVRAHFRPHVEMAQTDRGEA